MEIKKENLYKWKFLRLNKDYRDDFDKLETIKNDELYENHYNHICSKWFLKKPLDYRIEELKEEVFANFDGIVQFEEKKYSEVFALDPEVHLKDRNKVRLQHFNNWPDFLGDEPRFLKIILDLYSDIDLERLKDEIKEIQKVRRTKVKQTKMTEKNLESLVRIYELGAEHLGGMNTYQIGKEMGIDKPKDVEAKFETATSIVEYIVFFNQKFRL